MLGFVFGLLIGGAISLCIAHFYYKKSSQDQRNALESLSNDLKGTNTLKHFEFLIDNGTWKKEFIENREIWVSEKNNIFQIHQSDSRDKFDEPWTTMYPDQCTFRCSVYLKINETTIKELSFIILDGGRIFVPMPDRVFDKDNNPKFFWNTNSLELKVCRIIGHYYIHKDIAGIAKMSKISILS